MFINKFTVVMLHSWKPPNVRKERGRGKWGFSLFSSGDAGGNGVAGIIGRWKRTLQRRNVYPGPHQNTYYNRILTSSDEVNRWGLVLKLSCGEDFPMLHHLLLNLLGYPPTLFQRLQSEAVKKWKWNRSSNSSKMWKGSEVGLPF